MNNISLLLLSIESKLKLFALSLISNPFVMSFRIMNSHSLKRARFIRYFMHIAGHDYYVKLVGRLVQSIQGKMPFPFMDWRFNEFPNEGAHALYSTCVEVMGLPLMDCAQVR